ncbi:MAG: replicative DNA helicase, partial [Victivallales bacterium]|nr:replicative DNA helicase [Victivallales bacterium]
IATTANFENWCQIVRDYHILRGMINVCSDSLRQCYDVDRDIKSIIDEIESRIYQVRNNNVKSEIISLRESIRDVFTNIQKIINNEVEVGIPTLYPDLNRLIIGLKPGEMFVLAARPSIGKTTFALNIVRDVAMKGSQQRGVLFFSLEMTAEQIARKLLCMEAEVGEGSFYDKSFRPHDLTKLTTAVSNFRNASIFIDPTAGLTVPEMRAKVRRLKSQHSVELVCIDYLQLMRSGSNPESRQQEVAEISSGIKKLAKDFNIPVLVLAQLNREVEKGSSGSARPKLSNLRESGAIEQDADIVAFLHRDRDQAKDMSREAMVNGLDTELIVEKNRNGQTGIVYLTFHPHIGQFRSKSRYSDEDNPQVG